RLAYWAGGNPFHHHQDLGRLAQAFQRLDTFVVHEIGWTATARHADIVLPCTMTLERDDIGASPTDDLMVAMQQVVPPYADARNDY
ncbi:molybdopterin-dependent oxidoreductase, partial [Streptococcus gallolyticus]